jgi:hypothetical protein
MISGGPWDHATFDSEDSEQDSLAKMKREFAVASYESTNLGTPGMILNSQAVAELNQLREAAGLEGRTITVTDSHRIFQSSRRSEHRRWHSKS